MEDEIVQLIVAVDDPESGLALVGQIRLVPFDHFVEFGDLPDGLVSCDVDGLGLSDRDAGKGLNLTRKVGRRRSEGGEAEFRGGERGKGG